MIARRRAVSLVETEQDLTGKRCRAACLRGDHIRDDEEKEETPEH
jgi:hypothetical protein